MAEGSREQQNQGLVASSAQKTSEANNILIGEQHGDVSLDVQMSTVADLVREEDDSGGDTSIVLETLDVSQEKANDVVLVQGVGDVSLPDIVHVEDISPCDPMAIESVLSSESESEVDTSQSSSVHVVEENVENNGVAQSSQVQQVQSLAEPVQSLQSVPKVTCSAIPVYSKGNFEDVYVASIQKPLMMVESQFSQLRWNDTDMVMHPPATEIEV